MHLKDELEQRGFLYQHTGEELFWLYDKGGETLYFGCDPTAQSLHLGNFVVFMNAVNFMKRGNKLILIVWGATGMIGDPGWKDAERTFLDEQTLADNVEAIKKQVGWILQNLSTLSWVDFQFEVINNKDFYKEMSYLGFLREVGKYITVNQMMAKETVKKRIEDPDKSISYTEFSYMLLQGYDFVRLYQDRWCKLQISWSDQWGNIVTGTELIKKKLDGEAYGMTSPLVLDSSGKKFGKSEWNALWLNSTMTTPFKVYQYFMNVSDEDVSRFLKLFTLLPLEDIDAIVQKHGKNTADRYGQGQLARYITETIHGKVAMETAVKVTEFLFGEGNKMEYLMSMSGDEIAAVGHEIWWLTLSWDMSIIDALVESWLDASRGDAKKSIQAGAVYLNEMKVEDIAAMVDKNNSVNGYMLLRKGKKNFRILSIDIRKNTWWAIPQI
jgi:tyrosyl-tRNA synthetase